MRENVRLRINEIPVTVKQGTPVLDAAKSVNVPIPTLCHHKALVAEFGCRLCIVEIFPSGQIDGEGKIDTACTYPAEEGILVRTHSPRVMAQRKTILQLLLARAPESRVIRRIAIEYGIEETPFATPDEGASNCILCGMCLKVCNEVIGANAIGAAFRGVKKQIISPFNIASELCHGCMACAKVCPTGEIQFRMEKGRLIKEDWGVDLKICFCTQCGKSIGTEKQIERLRKQIGVEEEVLHLCSDCRRKRMIS